MSAPTPDNNDFRNAVLLTIFVAVFIVVVALVNTGITSAATTTAEDRPDWQSPLTVQNIYKNQVAWKDYTEAIDADIEKTDDLDLTIDLMGEAYSVTLELLYFTEQETYPEGSCAQDMFFFSTTTLHLWADFYGSLYYNLTASVGEPIDTGPIVAEWEQWSSVAPEMVPERCWAKVN